MSNKAYDPRAAPPRVLGVSALALAMVNCIVGASIFKLPAEVAAMIGPAALLGYLVCSLILALVGLCLAEAGSRVSEPGGLYAYTSIAFGPIVGGSMGTLSWLAYVTSTAAVASLWAESLASIWPVLATHPARDALVLSLWGILAALNIRGARQGSFVSLVFAVFKVVPLLVIAFIGIFTAVPANLEITSLPSFGRFGEAVVFLFFSFGGVESGLSASGEVSDPRRTIPRAIFIAAVLVAVLYMSVQVAAQGVLGPRLPASPAPLVSVAQEVLGTSGARFMLVATLVSTTGYLVADVLCSPRLLFALAERRQLPRLFTALNHRSGTPTAAIAAYAAVTAVLTLSGSFRSLAIFSSSTTLLTYLVSCLALIRLRARGVAQAGMPFNAPGGTALPVFTAILVGSLLIALPRAEQLATLVPLSLAAAAYFVQERIQHSRTAAHHERTRRQASL